MTIREVYKIAAMQIKWCQR